MLPYIYINTHLLLALNEVLVGMLQTPLRQVSLVRSLEVLGARYLVVLARHQAHDLPDLHFGYLPRGELALQVLSVVVFEGAAVTVPWGSLIQLKFVLKLKFLRKLVIQTHDNNFATE